MSRFSRINTIWRKELADTLRDRRTLIAMVVVPMILYPVLMLGSLQAFEVQTSMLKRETYDVAVPNLETARWLKHLIETDPSRRILFARRENPELAEQPPPPPDETPPAPTQELPRDTSEERARQDVRRLPPDYKVFVESDVHQAVKDGVRRAGVILNHAPSGDADLRSLRIAVVQDQTNIRSQMAAGGLEGIFERESQRQMERRLQRLQLTPEFIEPIRLEEVSVATPEKVGGSILGMVVPLILIVMTITGAVYPAIDLTAGERERGTLETLMVAPVPTVDLITGKFIVVASIGMLSALLNLLSIGGTVYLGGFGSLLSRGHAVTIPINVLPLVLVILIPLAVMFSAVLLAVCSFARSFKEAQNYVMPVMIAALIPAVVGVLPGTELKGPLLVMPVANIVILTKNLFLNEIDPVAIATVVLSTSLYAGAAVAVAARLFGQEAVLFADSGSIKTIFKRRFFKPTLVPSAAQAFLLAAILFSLNFFVQTALQKSAGFDGLRLFVEIAITLVILFVLLPIGAAAYMRVNVPTAFSLQPPPPHAWLPAICFGLSTWVLAQVWFVFQNTWLPPPPGMSEVSSALSETLNRTNLGVLIVLLALIPALVEEFFFRGYTLNGLKGALNPAGALLIVALAFALNHHMAYRVPLTFLLGILLGLLALRYRSIWPGVLAHAMHNGISIAADRADGLRPLFQRLGFDVDHPLNSPMWIVGACALAIIGIALCALPRRTEEAPLGARAPSPA